MKNKAYILGLIRHKVQQIDKLDEDIKRGIIYGRNALCRKQALYSDLFCLRKKLLEFTV